MKNVRWSSQEQVDFMNAVIQDLKDQQRDLTLLQITVFLNSITLVLIGIGMVLRG